MTMHVPLLVLVLVGTCWSAPTGQRGARGASSRSSLLTGEDFLQVFMSSQDSHSSYYHHNTIPHRDSYHHFQDISAAPATETPHPQEPTTAASTSFQGDDQQGLSTTEDANETSGTTFVTTERQETSTFLWEPEKQRTQLPSQVVSVRVSSSVVRQRPHANKSKKPSQENSRETSRESPKEFTNKEAAVLEWRVQAEDVPRVTAIQRSHFGVEEMSRIIDLSPVESRETKAKSVSYSQEIRVEGRSHRVGHQQDSFPDATHEYAARVQEIQIKPDSIDSEKEHDKIDHHKNYAHAQALTFQVNHPEDPETRPVSYQTSVTSATSGSRVQFYREPPGYHRQPPKAHIEGQGPQESRREQPSPFQQGIQFTQQKLLGSSSELRTESYANTQVFGNQPKPYEHKPFGLPETRTEQYGTTQVGFSPPFPSQKNYEVPQQKIGEFGTVQHSFRSNNEAYRNQPKLFQDSRTEAYEKQLKQFPVPKTFSSQPGTENYESSQVSNYDLHPQKEFAPSDLRFTSTQGTFSQQSSLFDNQNKNAESQPKVYNEPEKVYGEPEKVYGEPEKVYGEPEKVYGEPEKVYGEPEKVYGEPEKVYGEPERVYGRPEQNYEVDEATNVATNGQAHGVQPATSPTTENPQESESESESEQDKKNKFGYVVEGRNFRKYRVEERTPDGFIVGEYGVVSHDDGSLRGVRYTAESNINPRLIYDALVKFLSLK